MNELLPLRGLLFDDVSIAFDEKTFLLQRILRYGQGGGRLRWAVTN